MKNLLHNDGYELVLNKIRVDILGHTLVDNWPIKAMTIIMLLKDLM
jgi:hypothetical protein